MHKEVEELLTQGLLEGYAGKTKPLNVWRNCFALKATQIKTPDGKIYRDEWTAGRLGGGQEIVSVDWNGGERAVRSYQGGTFEPEALEKLGITEAEVIGYLKRKILELGGATRLYKECNPEPDQDWKYAYQILNQIPEISLTVGIETIDFKGRQVFAHGIMISPLK